MKDHGLVIDLQAVRQQRIDVAALARQRFANARRSLGLSRAAFADLLTEALGWQVAAGAVTAWESAAVPPGDVLLAAELIARTSQPVVTPLGEAVPESNGMRLLDSYEEVQDALRAVVDGAQETLGITGSRSRDPDYLARIEVAITAKPELVHYRVLYGPPRHGALKNHLLRLIDLQRPAGTLHIGIATDLYKDNERFICVSEQLAVIVLPSVTSLSNFDTALVIDDPEVAADYVTHVRQGWLGSEVLSTRAQVEHLEVLR
jgi:hypothetical protein